MGSFLLYLGKLSEQGSSLLIILCSHITEKRIGGFTPYDFSSFFACVPYVTRHTASNVFQTANRSITNLDYLY